MKSSKKLFLMSMLCFIALAIVFVFPVFAQASEYLQITDELKLSTNVWTALMTVLMFIFVDTVFGILISVKDKTFSAEKLPQFLGTHILPVFLVLCLFAGVATVSTDLYAFFYTMAGMALIRYVASIKKKIVVFKDLLLGR